MRMHPLNHLDWNPPRIARHVATHSATPTRGENCPVRGAWGAERRELCAHLGRSVRQGHSRASRRCGTRRWQGVGPFPAPATRSVESRLARSSLLSLTYQQPVLCITISVDTVVGCNKNGPTNHRGWVRYRVATFAAYTTSGLFPMLEGLQRI